MDLNDILVFARVVQSGSFVGAARALGMPKSTVSRKVAELEERLGARLLQRTTRRLNLTDVGRIYYQHAARVVAEIEEAELAVTRLQDAPRGLLRVTAPLNFGFMGKVVASFLVRYPEVEVELVCADRLVDIVHEGFDVAVRVGGLSDSTLIARSLGSLESNVVASPAFLADHGTPTEPEQLAALPALLFAGSPDPTTWRLVRGSEARAVRVRPRLAVNDFEFLEEAATAGLGVGLLPLFRCGADVLQGRLLRVLPEWRSAEVPLHAMYPSTRHLSPKVTAFVEHLREHLTPASRGPRAGLPPA